MHCLHLTPYSRPGWSWVCGLYSWRIHVRFNAPEGSLAAWLSSLFSSSSQLSLSSKWGRAVSLTGSGQPSLSSITSVTGNSFQFLSICTQPGTHARSPSLWVSSASAWSPSSSPCVSAPAPCYMGALSLCQGSGGGQRGRVWRMPWNVILLYRDKPTFKS